MRLEFIGTILEIRNVEDSIRATRRYTKGLFRKEAQHPIQGAEFPSKALTEYYEVYPNVDLNWDMPASVAWAWVWGDERHIDILFKYDYRKDQASVYVQDGIPAVKELSRAIPGFGAAMAVTKEKNNRNKNGSNGKH